MERVPAAEYFHARQACYLCLDPTDVVDTSIVIEGEGVLAIGRSCIRDLAMTAGFTIGEDRSNEVEQAKAERDAAIERAEKAEELVGRLHDYERRLGSVEKARAAKAAKAPVKA